MILDLASQDNSQEFKQLKEAAGAVLENLWPEAPLPNSLHDLSIRLDGAPAGIDEQLEMAARGGSDMALALVKSWYPNVKMDMLVGGFHTGTSLASLRPKIAVASGRIAKAVDLTQLVPAEPSTTAQPAEGVEAVDTAATLP